ncbi:MAG: M16 family metallopeptidase [Acidithiobacillales bacterium]
MRLIRCVALILAAVTTTARSAQEPGKPPGEKGPSATAAPSTDVLPFKATEKTLPNGLKVIVVPTGFPNIVSLQIPVQTGSRNEVEPGKTGFAHFFEHIMFRGTKDVSPEQYQDALTKAGARSNAYTTDDYTCYHTTFAKEDLETMLRLEADRFENLSYPEAVFKTEARAVLGEYNKNSSNPLRKLDEVQQETAFDVHTYKHTTMGFLKDIEEMPNQYAYSKTFFDRWYRPEYTTLIVAGDVDPGVVIPLVEKYWGGWKHGSYKVAIPQEPRHAAPRYAHVTWESPTLPWVTVAFHGPAFSETSKDYAAFDILFDLAFGRTSDLYRRLVEQEQKVDPLLAYAPDSADPPLYTVAARVKKLDDALYVRDEILKTFEKIRTESFPEKMVAEAISNNRYGLVRRFDNTESIAGILARFVRYRRSYDTLNQYFRTASTVTSADLLAAARKYVVDGEMVVTTLSKEQLPQAIATLPPLSSFAPPPSPADLKLITQNPEFPQIVVKLAFRAGSAHDPKGKEGLAALTAAMIAEAGSKAMRIDEVQKALYPVAGSFGDQVDKELTTFTGVIHRDNWKVLADVALPQLVDPGFREEDFKRLKDRQRNALIQNLRSNNEEELAKEELQNDIFAGTPYGHTVLGTVAGLDAITLDDVKAFAKAAYTRAGLLAGISGAAPVEMTKRLEADLGRLPGGPPLPAPSGVVPHEPKGIEVEIIQKETRATAISFGHPMSVTRAHPDFAALSLAKVWLGEHRSSQSHLFQRLRELRGLNYGDYAYIEAFPRGMFQFFPDANIPRRSQIFEVWIRPVVPENGPMALRIALYEVGKLIGNGLSQEDFEATREYLMKNVYLLTSTQDHQLGYAIDSEWYGIPEFTSYMRGKIAKLTRDDVNAAIRKYFSASDLSVVIVTKDAAGLKEKLVTDTAPAIKYDSEKPKAVTEEDKLIGAMKLGIKPDNVKITPVDAVFAR